MTPSTSSQELSIHGDVRYRSERLKKTGSKVNKRDRIRARLNIEATLSKKISALIGISSGQKNTSRNQTLTNYFEPKEVNLNLAHIHWKWSQKSSLKLGKMEIPYITPGKSDLLLNSNITPEGLNFSFSKKFLKLETNLKISKFWLMDEKKISDQIWRGGQLNLSLFFSKLRFKAGVSFFDTTFENLDTDILEGYLSFKTPFFVTSLELWLDIMENIKSPTASRASMIGLLLGTPRKAYDIELSIQYGDFDRHSVIAGLTHGKNNSHIREKEFRATLLLTKELKLATRLTFEENMTKKELSKSLKMDLSVKF